MHECVWKGCKLLAPRDHALCNEHVRVVPAEIKRRLRGTWQAGVPVDEQGTAFKQAAWELRDWIQRVFEGTDRGHDPGRWERLVSWVRDRDARRKERTNATTTTDPRGLAASPTTEEP